MEQETMEAMNTGKLLREAYPKIKLTQEIASLGTALTKVQPKPVQNYGLLGFIKRKRGV
jgi:Flp pilus assembly CpaE family ATPase